MPNSESNAMTTMPLIAGLAAGIAFMLLMSGLADSLSTIRASPANEFAFVIMTVDGLQESYEAGEPISFSLLTRGFSQNICNYPEPSVRISNLDSGESVWHTPPSFQTAALCPSTPFYIDWRFGYEGEELPFQSALAYDRYYENHIAIAEAGSYRLSAKFEDHSVEKDFVVK